MTQKSKTTERGPGQKVVSVAMDKELLAIIDKMAAEQGRTRSNMIRYILENEMKEYQLGEIEIAPEVHNPYPPDWDKVKGVDEDSKRA